MEVQILEEAVAVAVTEVVAAVAVVAAAAVAAAARLQGRCMMRSFL